MGGCSIMMQANEGAVQFLIHSYVVRFHFRLVFVGLVLKSLCIGPKSNLHGDFKSHPKTDDVKTKKKL